MLVLVVFVLALGGTACARETREQSTTLMYKSLSLPSDITVKEYPENQNGKRWQLTRETKRINRAHLGVPKECREKPTMFDPTIYVGYACPDPTDSRAECLIDLFPTNGSQAADPSDGVDLIIKCGQMTGATRPATTAASAGTETLPGTRSPAGPSR